MSHLADTSVLIRTVHTTSPHQQIAIDAINKLKQDKETICLVPQNLIEFWAVATRPTESNGLGLTVAEAGRKIEQLKQMFVLQKENEDIFTNWERLVKDYEVKGKTTHDARLVAAMRTYGISHLLTFNVSDFKRYEDVITVVSPQDVMK